MNVEGSVKFGILNRSIGQELEILEIKILGYTYLLDWKWEDIMAHVEIRYPPTSILF